MDAELTRQIAAGNLDAVEEAFLARLEASPPDGTLLGEIGRAIAGAGDTDRATTLLQMADDQLRQTKQWRARLQLLRRAGNLLYRDPLALHDEIVRSTLGAHDGSELCRKLLDKAGLHRAPEDIPKTWEKVDRVDEL